jgi:hypothetical protein
VNDPNVAATLLRHGNFDYVTNSVVWDPGISDHDLSDSMYLNRMPDWWCQETPWPAIGPDVAGYANKIPAQRRFEGLPCTQLHLRLSGLSGDETISLTWEVSGSLPGGSTWRISYEGPAGDLPSPISGLAESIRLYNLTGLTNYTPYDISLNAMQGGTPILTGTITAMPTDILIRLPVVKK